MVWIKNLNARTGAEHYLIDRLKVSVSPYFEQDNPPLVRELIENADYQCMSALLSALQTRIYGLVACSELEGSQTQFHQTLSSAIHEMQRLIDNVLELTSPQSDLRPTQITETDIGQIVQEAIYSATLSIPGNTPEINLMTEENVPQCLILDKERLFRVLESLICLAVASRQSIDLRVSVNKEKAADEIRFEIEYAEDFLVSDIDKVLNSYEAHDETFCLFQKQSMVSVAACKVMIERLGGQIGYIYEIDVASLLWFSVPFKHVESRPVSCQVFSRNSNHIALDNVLITGFDQANSHAMSEILADAGICSLVSDLVDGCHKVDFSCMFADISPFSTRSVARLKTHLNSQTVLPVVGVTSNRYQSSLMVSSSSFVDIIEMPIDSLSVKRALSLTLEAIGSNEVWGQSVDSRVSLREKLYYAVGDVCMKNFIQKFEVDDIPWILEKYCGEAEYILRDILCEYETDRTLDRGKIESIASLSKLLEFDFMLRHAEWLLDTRAIDNSHLVVNKSNIVLNDLVRVQHALRNMIL